MKVSSDVKVASAENAANAAKCCYFDEFSEPRFGGAFFNVRSFHRRKTTFHIQAGTIRLCAAQVRSMAISTSRLIGIVGFFVSSFCKIAKFGGILLRSMPPGGAKFIAPDSGGDELSLPPVRGVIPVAAQTSYPVGW